jgi:signal peptidase I (EC:3.4.21.89). Serine peptidase. MEROPS family S26A
MAISPEKRKQILKDVRQLVLMAAIILTGRSVLADWYVVPTGSMKPTILEGDRVFVWKSAYQIRVPFSKIRLMTTGEPRRGDVVVVRNPDGGSVPFVKRLIGLPGDVVELRNEALLVNGKPQKVEYLEPLTCRTATSRSSAPSGSTAGRTRSGSCRNAPPFETSARSRSRRERSF